MEDKGYLLSSCILLVYLKKAYLNPFSLIVYIEVSKGRISVSTHSSLTLRSMTYQSAQRQVTKTGLTAWLLNNNNYYDYCDHYDGHQAINNYYYTTLPGDIQI